jgi:hypothetical protein
MGGWGLRLSIPGPVRQQRPGSESASSTSQTDLFRFASDALLLQRLIGNQAACRLLEDTIAPAQARIGQADDQSEHKVDATETRVRRSLGSVALGVDARLHPTARSLDPGGHDARCPQPPLGLVQRMPRYGADPKTLITPTSKDLLYGLTSPRFSTMGRLEENQLNTIRTIDDYNHAVGINDVMKLDRAAMGLYDIRAELASSEAWRLPLNGDMNTPANKEAIQKWITFLRENQAYVGLEDLGQKMNKKNRFEKNRVDSQTNVSTGDKLTTTDTSWFLSPANPKAMAQSMYDAMSPEKQAALNKWVYTAFFRRTSKLGQDFTIKVLKAKVHFNTVADPNFDRAKGPQWQDHGLETVSAGKNDQNRAITVSEFRHMKKLSASHPDAFNLYGES